MILSAGMTMSMKKSPVPRLKVNVKRNGLPVSVASMSKSSIRTDTEQLRNQIDQLKHEAEITRSKANNARVRLMRLSQAAENLQHWAVMDVALCKENEARELLMQNKKILQALERTKRRLEVLDELSMKINEAISLKETQLIGNVSLFPEINKEDSSPEIRIISPKSNFRTDAMESEILDPKHAEVCDEHDVDSVEQETHIFSNHEPEIITDALVSDGMMSDLRAISSYEDFLKHLDEQLWQVESDICNFLRFSMMILESKQKETNTKVQQASEILEHVRGTRARIVSIMKTRENDG